MTNTDMVHNSGTHVTMSLVSMTNQCVVRRQSVAIVATLFWTSLFGLVMLQDCQRSGRWETAQQCCSGEGLSLPSANNSNAVWRGMRELGVSSVWLDLKWRQLPGWTWVDGSVYTDTESPRLQHLQCAVLAKEEQRQIMDPYCSTRGLPYICQKHGCGSCQAVGSTSSSCVHTQGSCYIYYKSAKNWYDARSNCLKKGMDLAVAKGASLQSTLAAFNWAFTSEAGRIYVWIGLRHETWETQGGTLNVARDVHWAQGEPAHTGRCAQAKLEGGRYVWRALPCDNRTNIMCFRGKVAVLPNLKTSTAEIPASSDGAGRRGTEPYAHDPADGTGGGLHSGAIAAIVICLLLLLAFGLVVYIFRYQIQDAIHKRRNRQGEENSLLLEDVDADALTKRIAANMRDRHRHLEIFNWEDKKASVPIDNIYTEMKWMEHTEGIGGSEHQILKHYTDMFTQDKKEDQIGDRKEVDGSMRIVVFGDPGVGKTTFAKRLLVDWARTKLKGKGKGLSTAHLHRLNRFKYVVPIFLREVNEGMTLLEIIEDQLNLETRRAEELLTRIEENLSDTLIILEGYDEFIESRSKDIVDIVKCKLFFTVNTMITCRTHAFPSLNIAPHSCPSKVELLGFSKESVGQYVSTYFALCKQEDSSKAERLLTEIEANENLRQFSRYPAILLLMCILWRERDRLASTITEFYTDFVLYACARYHRKVGEGTNNSTNQIDYREIYKEELLKVGEWALNALENDQLRLVFSYKDTFNFIGPRAWDLGFLRTFKNSPRTEFPHKSLQEFFAAYFIVNCVTGAGSKILLRFCSSSEQLHHGKMIVTFVCGMSEEMGNKMRKRLEGVISTWEEGAVITEGSRTDFLITFISENPNVSFALPRTVAFDPGRYTRGVVQRFLQMDADAVCEVMLTTRSLGHLECLSFLNKKVIEKVEIDAASFSKGKPVKIDDDLLQRISNLEGNLVIKHFKLNKLKEKDNFLVFRQLLLCIDTVHIDVVDMTLVDFGHECLRAFTNMLGKLNTLTQVSLRACRCEDSEDWYNFLSKLPGLTNLELLDLSHNTLGPESLQILATSMASLHRLQDLRLQTCGVGGGSSFLTFLQALPSSIRNLDLCENALGDELRHMESVGNKLAEVSTLDIGKNGVSESLRESLQTYFDINHHEMSVIY